MDMTRNYRAYFLSRADHIRTVTVIRQPGDADACLEAERLLLAQSVYGAIEVWEKRRLVWRFERNPPAVNDVLALIDLPLSA
jgi:hypothetical protein